AWIPIIVIFREFAVSGYRLIAVQTKGEVVAANIWGKLKTVSQMIAIILMFLDVNSYGAIFTGNLTGFAFALNLITTLLMTISVIATIFSGYEYLKGGKELLKDC
ncbi:MAG: CDP-alcohol phosphatidyltransferase family protein, partial [Clostridia bacterium]